MINTISVAGKKFKVDDPDPGTGYWQQVNNNVWEPETYQVFNTYLKQDKSYLDIGSWIGPTVLYGCQLSRYCYAIEPDPVALEVLKRNISLNDFNNIGIFEVAIADKRGEIEISSPNSSLGDSCTSYLYKIGTVAKVPCLGLEDFFIDNQIWDCNFIKMDTEGAEFITLPQAAYFIKDLKPVLYLSLHYLSFKSDNYFDVIRDSLSMTYPHFYLTEQKGMIKKTWKELNEVKSWQTILLGV